MAAAAGRPQERTPLRIDVDLVAEPATASAPDAIPRAIASRFHSESEPIAVAPDPAPAPRGLGLSPELLGRLDRRAMSADELAQVGHVLGQVAFPGPNGQAYLRDALLVAERQERPLQVRFHLGDRELERLPWELVRASAADGRSGDPGYVAANRWTSLVRCPPEGPRARSGPLDVFAVEAIGTGGDDGELRRGPPIPGIAADSIRIPDPCTHRRVVLRTRQRPGGCPVFYLLTHGHRADGSGRPTVSLSDRRVDAAELGQLLAECHTQLAVIAACDVGSGAGWSGFGATLARHVPAVVSMQARVDVGGAERFVARVLHELQCGATIDWAVAEARREVRLSSPFADWWVPMLHAHDPDGLRFDVANGHHDDGRGNGANRRADPPALARHTVFLAPAGTGPVVSLTVRHGAVHRGEASYLE